MALAKRRKALVLRFPSASHEIMDRIRDGRVIRGYIGIGGRNRAAARASRSSGMDPIQGVSLMK